MKEEEHEENESRLRLHPRTDGERERVFTSRSTRASKIIALEHSRREKKKEKTFEKRENGAFVVFVFGI